MPARIEFSAKDIRDTVRDYENGTSMEQLANEFGVSIPVIRRVLVEAGVTIRPQGRQPQG